MMPLNRKFKADIQESIVDANISMRSAAPSRCSSCLPHLSSVRMSYQLVAAVQVVLPRGASTGKPVIKEARSGVQLDEEQLSNSSSSEEVGKHFLHQPLDLGFLKKKKKKPGRNSTTRCE